ncbi:tyrosine-type recombinase/integrase [Sphingomonas glaciei]|uniref:Integrase family protein n=1 Tax=Sphingomonas glaciei TaxID=2938948 RepID=A0ABY5MVU5_9SPHN|nr:integrase family protein [Sphingomonas glaciei]UUR08242.1 integrase family protein [Sphingomonas glaciei]
MAKLSKTFVEKVQPPATGHEVHWDGGHDRAVKGYGLRVSSLGKRVFIVSGRVRGKQLQYTVGPFGQLTEDEARSKARTILQQMREGIDPRDVKKADEAAKITLAEVCKQYVSRPGKLKDSSKAEIERHVAKVFADWQHKPIAEITEAQVRKRYREMATKGLTGKPAPGQANISMTTLRSLINYAARQFKKADGSPLITHNPVSALRDDWIQLKPRTRDVDTRKVGEVWHMLTTLRADLIAAQQREDGRVNPQDADKQAGVDLALFLLLTGARRNEGAKLEWKNVNLEEGWFHLPDPKNANPVWIPLSVQAKALLSARPRVRGNPYVFATRSKAGHVVDTRAPLTRVSEIAGQTLSAHDLRRTFVSVAVTVCNVDLYRVELLTNHVPRSVTTRHYLQTSRLQYLQPEVERIGTWMEDQGRIAEAKASGGNVVTLRA